MSYRALQIKLMLLQQVHQCQDPWQPWVCCSWSSPLQWQWVTRYGHPLFKRRKGEGPSINDILMLLLVSYSRNLPSFSQDLDNPLCWHHLWIALKITCLDIERLTWYNNIEYQIYPIRLLLATWGDRDHSFRGDHSMKPKWRTRATGYWTQLVQKPQNGEDIQRGWWVLKHVASFDTLSSSLLSCRQDKSHNLNDLELQYLRICWLHSKYFVLVTPMVLQARCAQPILVSWNSANTSNWGRSQEPSELGTITLHGGDT